MTATVTTPTTSAPGCIAPSACRLVRAPGSSPSSSGNWLNRISSATPFMKPASTGRGTRRASPARPRRPINTCSTPDRATAAPAPATMTPVSGRCTRRGSASSTITSEARINAVAELGPATGKAARPAAAYTSPPTTAVTKVADRPTAAAADPSGENASSPSVSTTASTDIEPTAPPSTSAEVEVGDGVCQFAGVVGTAMRDGSVGEAMRISHRECHAGCKGD